MVKLADFGVAAQLDQETNKLGMTVVGTPYWMAPEVVEMTGLSPASDIWSVGALAVELLTGQPPYFDLHPMSALYKIVQVCVPLEPGSAAAAAPAAAYGSSRARARMHMGTPSAYLVPTALLESCMAELTVQEAG